MATITDKARRNETYPINAVEYRILQTFYDYYFNFFENQTASIKNNLVRMYGSKDGYALNEAWTALKQYQTTEQGKATVTNKYNDYLQVDIPKEFKETEYAVTYSKELPESDKKELGLIKDEGQGDESQGDKTKDEIISDLQAQIQALNLLIDDLQNQNTGSKIELEGYIDVNSLLELDTDKNGLISFDKLSNLINKIQEA